MSVTISIPAAAGHVCGEAVGDKPLPGQDILDVIYHTVHGFAGGTQALATRMNIPLETLRQKANPNNTQHVFHPRQLLNLMFFTGNAGVLHTMAAHLGYGVVSAMPDQSGGEPVAAQMRLQMEFAELVRATSEPVLRLQAQPGHGVTGNEMRRAEYHAQELQAAITHMLATLRAHMPQAPGGAAC